MIDDVINFLPEGPTFGIKAVAYSIALTLTDKQEADRQQNSKIGQ